MRYVRLKTPVEVRKYGVLVHFWCVFLDIEKAYKIDYQYLVGFIQRRERDSNPRKLSLQRFSRPPQSTTLPSLQWSSIWFPSAKVIRFFEPCKYFDEKISKKFISPRFFSTLGVPCHFYRPKQPLHRSPILPAPLLPMLWELPFLALGRGKISLLWWVA